MDQVALKAKIVSIIQDNFPGVNPHAPLFSQYNSLALVQLIVCLEEGLDINIDNLEVHSENFQNIESITVLIFKKITHGKI